MNIFPQKKFTTRSVLLQVRRVGEPRTRAGAVRLHGAAGPHRLRSEGPGVGPHGEPQTRPLHRRGEGHGELFVARDK